jgi:hypothetical protein
MLLGRALETIGAELQYAAIFNEELGEATVLRECSQSAVVHIELESRRRKEVPSRPSEAALQRARRWRRLEALEHQPIDRCRLTEYEEIEVGAHVRVVLECLGKHVAEVVSDAVRVDLTDHIEGALHSLALCRHGARDRVRERLASFDRPLDHSNEDGVLAKQR